MNLTSGGKPITVWEGDDPLPVLVERIPELHSFRPVQRITTWTVKDEADPNYGREYSSWIWSCEALDKASGRCTRWETRPALCARYEPASGDGLCVFSQALENGEESALC